MSTFLNNSQNMSSTVIGTFGGAFSMGKSKRCIKNLRFKKINNFHLKILNFILEIFI